MAIRDLHTRAQCPDAQGPIVRWRRPWHAPRAPCQCDAVEGLRQRGRGVRWLGWIVLALGTIGSLADAQTPPVSVPRTELTLLTGAESGTYYAMGRDIKRLLNEVAPDSGIDLAVVPSQGALQNVIDVFRYSSIQLGITQSD